MTVKEGDIVGGHRVVELAGCGGMGAVYKTEHLITRRIEAMKVLPLGVGRGPDEILRFEREIQVQARLQHPNIAALYGAIREENAIALIMEYVEGESLERLLARRRLPVDLAARYASQILEALAYAHQNGVFHCDVSPANILITREGIAKLTDFGLARAATDLGLSSEGVAIGSPWQMSPEQVRGTDPLDGRTDVYAMGAVLYEMLTGRKLFEVEGAFAILRAHLDTIPAPPRRFRRDIPPALDKVIGKALAKDPGSRFQTAGDFREALEAAIAGRRRVVPRAVAAAAGMAAIVCAAAFQIHPPRRAPEPAVAEIPLPPAPLPNIPPAPLTAPAAAPVPVPDESAPKAPLLRAAPRRAVAGSPRRVVPRVSLQTAAADAALPDAPSVEAIRVETPPDLPFDARPAAIEEPKKPGGNRFVRALGKLNPFRKGDKDDAPDKRP